MYVAHWLFAHNPNRSNLDALYLHLYESNDWLPILLLPVIPLFSIRPASSTTDGSNIQTALAEPLNSKIMLENSLSSIPTSYKFCEYNLQTCNQQIFYLTACMLYVFQINTGMP